MLVWSVREDQQREDKKVRLMGMGHGYHTALGTQNRQSQPLFSLLSMLSPAPSPENCT